jgi:hypothetical protein
MEPQDRDMLIRIDERTETLVDLFERHVEQDRMDFKEIHTRINHISAKQNWMLGVGTTVGVVVGIIGAWLKSTFTGGA